MQRSNTSSLQTSSYGALFYAVISLIAGTLVYAATQLPIRG